MGLQLSQEMTLADVPLDWSTFLLGGTDRIDLRANGNDVRVELRPPNQSWRSFDPIHVQADTFESINGLAISYPPAGVWGFRLSNWTAGLVATAVVRAYSVGR